ncbi:MAG: 2-hydroxyacyl-CoA dehydratase [Spirochaetales bacterium]|nr:MAG: 2-hydroxyacyl-CoA dehydratase [Spirochaetales bacterium]
MNNLTMQLQELLSDPRNALINDALGKGMVPLGYTCSMVPRAILSVGKLFPVRLRAPGVSGTENADIYLSSVLCSYTRSILEFAMEGRYDFLGGWVFVACCDHMRRLDDNLGYAAKPEFSHMLDIPHKINKASMEWTIDELKRLATALEKHFGVDAGERALQKAIEEENSLSAALRELGELRREPKPRINGTVFHRLIMAAQVLPAVDVMQIIKDFRTALESSTSEKTHRARLMLVGGSLDDPGYTEIIESQGGLVVADRYCTGSLPGLEPIDTATAPFEALARQVLNGNRCPRMMDEFRNRKDYILKTAREYSADGVIIQSIKFCDTWGIESSALVSALREEGVAVLRLEREYRQSGEGQLRTRIQAFIESMGK